MADQVGEQGTAVEGKLLREAVPHDIGVEPRLDDAATRRRSASLRQEEVDGAACRNSSASLSPTRGGSEAQPRSRSFTLVSQIDLRFVPVVCSTNTSWVSQCGANHGPLYQV